MHIFPLQQEKKTQNVYTKFVMTVMSSAPQWASHDSPARFLWVNTRTQLASRSMLSLRHFFIQTLI